VIATVQFFDRALMVVILEPIKREFALSRRAARPAGRA
jgi:hypothetical protein